MLIWDIVLEKQSALADFIRQKMDELNIKTFRELSQLSGVSQGQISEVMSGKENPGRVFFSKLAPVLETTPEYLFSLSLKK